MSARMKENENAHLKYYKAMPTLQTFYLNTKTPFIEASLDL